MNGKLFSTIKYVKEVSLRQTACIDRTFTSKDDVLAMRQLVTTRCGFSEPKNRKNEVSCLVKKYPRLNLGDFCFFDDSTVISSRDFLISNSYENNVTTLSFKPSPYVKFLPILVNLNFPNLKYYQAPNCNITEITKVNFANLTQLIAIALKGNQIETVPKNTFEGLVLLGQIDLSK